ncbi:MAG: DUF6480 family protein [bacterium]
MTQPDPDPATTTGLEPGGGVPPGETPPGEAATFGVSAPQPPPGRGITRVALVVIGVLVVLVLLFVVGRAVSLF